MAGEDSALCTTLLRAALSSRGSQSRRANDRLPQAAASPAAAGRAVSRGRRLRCPSARAAAVAAPSWGLTRPWPASASARDEQELKPSSASPASCPGKWWDRAREEPGSGPPSAPPAHTAGGGRTLPPGRADRGALSPRSCLLRNTPPAAVTPPRGSPAPVLVTLWRERTLNHVVRAFNVHSALREPACTSVPASDARRTPGAQSRHTVPEPRCPPPGDKRPRCASGTAPEWLHAAQHRDPRGERGTDQCPDGARPRVCHSERPCSG